MFFEGVAGGLGVKGESISGVFRFFFQIKIRIKGGIWCFSFLLAKSFGFGLIKRLEQFFVWDCFV